MKDARIVYILRSESNPDKSYVGITSNLKDRLNKHNAGQSSYTSKFCPWKVETAIWFSDSKKARDFEIYLKNGSGYAFRKRHFESQL